MVFVTLLELDALFEGVEPDPDEELLLDPDPLLDPESDEPEPDDVVDAPDDVLAASVDEEVDRESVR
ncbi:hypothetical protein [Agromyces atrinae]|uniref:Uncharacterized protein n=1 Tax=Agromyces atrinae TaxID=592376 RepID=A0A852S906_9MICO|nr:hypothetical protein [Agromyces atrinae]NYD68696.1 hypothetical protein [Agromyces atrinae]